MATEKLDPRAELAKMEAEETAAKAAAEKLYGLLAPSFP